MFQSTVAPQLGAGVPGEMYNDGPRRARSYILRSTSAAYNIMGATALTVVSEGVAQAGGTGVFAGILAGPKEQANYGTGVGNALAPTMTVANEINAEAVEMGAMFVTVPGPAAIGDRVAYNNTTGALTTYAGNANFTGVIAVTTGVLTVSAMQAGGYIGTNTLLTGANVPAGTRVTAQLTGTPGGNGTYQTNITTAVASTAMSVPNNVNALGAGFTVVPNTEVYAYTITAAGLGVIKLTN